MDPLVFEPFFRPQPWGGRRLESLLGKRLPPEGRFGESWELSTHPLHVSRVAEGPLAGCSLTDLCSPCPEDRLGPAVKALSDFPLLVKFLDCDGLLSVQVHPNDAQARELLGEPCSKSEAWVVLAAEPKATVYAGLKQGVARADVERATATGTIPELLHSFAPQVGDCIYLPAGTVHAAGGGLLLAEVQQPSDATFRLYDWGRVGLDGRPRELHLEQALRCIDFAAGPVRPVVPKAVPEGGRERLVASPHFELSRYRLAEPLDWQAERPTVWLVVEGRAELTCRQTGYRRTCGRGDVLLVPAAQHCKTGFFWRPIAQATLLRVTG
jgi:mannose-6-phosphate isomerase